MSETVLAATLSGAEGVPEAADGGLAPRVGWPPATTPCGVEGIPAAAGGGAAP